MSNKMQFNYKNINYGNITASGNVHIGDNFYIVERDFQHSLLFLSIQRMEPPLLDDHEAQKAMTYKAQLSVKFRLQDAAQGEPLLREQVTITVPTSLYQELENFQNIRRGLDITSRTVRRLLPEWLKSEEERLSRFLHSTFFSGDIGAVCADFITLLEKSKIEELLLVISSDETEIINLPWEMTLPVLFLPKSEKEGMRVGLDRFGLVRTSEKALANFSVQGRILSAAPLKMLFVAMLPENMPEKDKLQEIEDKQRKVIEAVGSLEATGSQPRIAIEFLDNTSLEELGRALAKGRHDIVHISGHGAYMPEQQKGVLFLEDADGNEKTASGAELGGILRGHKSVRLVILSSCESAIAGSKGGIPEQLAAYGVPAIVAMRFAISDPAAKQFTSVFYDYLAKGETITYAFHQARTTLWEEICRLRENHRNDSLIAEWFTPVLYLNQYVGPLIDKERPYHLPDDFYPHSSFLKTRTTRLLGDGFIGRKRYLIRLRRLFASGQHICLHGLGGMGKTTLAEAFAHNYEKRSHIVIIFRNMLQINEKYIIEELLCRFEETNPPASLLRQLKFQLSNPDPAVTPTDKLQLLIENYLKGRKTILLFDNFEDVQRSDGDELQREIGSEALREFLRYFCQAAPEHCHLLFTTRYEITDLREYVVHMALDRLGFAEQYRLINFSPRLRQHNFRERLRIFEHLGGHPRSYEFLDSLMSNDREVLWNNLEARLDKVQNDAFEDLLLGEVYDRLTPEEQELSQLASVFIFRSPLTALAALSGQDLSQLIPVLRSLQAWSLCFLDEDQQEFEVHQLTRQWIASNYINMEEWLAWSKKAGDFFKERPLWQDEFLTAHYYEMAEEWDEFAKSSIKLAEYLCESHEFDIAINLLNNLTNKDIDLRFKTRAYKNLSAVYYVLGKPDEALPYVDKWIKLCIDSGDDSDEASGLMLLGRILLSIGEIDRARSCFNDSLLISKRIGDEEMVRTASNNIAMIAQMKGENNQAALIFYRNLEESQVSGDKQNECIALNNIAFIEMDKGNTDVALEHFKKCLDILEDLENHILKATALNNIGKIYIDKGDYQNAEKFLLEGLLICEKIGLRQIEAKILNNLGLLEDEFNLTLDFFNRSLIICREIGEIEGEALALLNIGAVEQKKENFEKAFELFHQSLEIFRKIENLNGIWQCHLNIALLQCDKNEFQAANASIDYAIEICKKIGNLPVIANHLNKIAGMHFEQERHNQALVLLRRSYELYVKIDPVVAQDISAGIEYISKVLEKEA